MLHIAIQIRDLITSNVSGVIDGASNPAKSLKLLRGEIEEAIISLTGDLSLTRSRVQRLSAEVTQLELRDSDWSDRAAVAMQNEREDLARAALLEREKLREVISSKQLEVKSCETQATELAHAVASLELKLSEARERLAEVEQAQLEMVAQGIGSGQSRAERQLNRIDTIERRASFAADNASLATSPSVEAEIEAMRRDRKISAELDALRAKAVKSRKK